MTVPVSACLKKKETHRCQRIGRHLMQKISNHSARSSWKLHTSKLGDCKQIGPAMWLIRMCTFLDMYSEPHTKIRIWRDKSISRYKLQKCPLTWRSASHLFADLSFLFCSAYWKGTNTHADGYRNLRSIPEKLNSLGLGFALLVRDLCYDVKWRWSGGVQCFPKKQLKGPDLYVIRYK